MRRGDEDLFGFIQRLQVSIRQVGEQGLTVCGEDEGMKGQDISTDPSASVIRVWVVLFTDVTDLLIQFTHFWGYKQTHWFRAVGHPVPKSND